MDALGSSNVFRFDRFRLHRRGGGLFSQDANGAWKPVEIGGRALELLGALLERQGDLVSRDEIMRVVWPGTVVEEHNLTVQISALRRVLDEGRDGGSCIQTVAGRGYRFVRPVMPAEQAPPEPGSPPAAGLPTGTLTAPRLSIVVLPFKNLSDDPRGGFLADGITDDLTTELTHIWGTFVVARETAYSFESKPTDVRKIGEELGVRYVLEGSIRWLSDSLRVNARLVSGETGAHLWSDRFDEPSADVAAAQEQIVTRLKDGLSISLVEIENARSLHERPTNPDAFDLILRARALRLLPSSLLRDKDVLALYERALVLIPSSATALVGVAFYLLLTTPQEDLGGSEVMQRIGTLLAQARTIAPDSPEVANASLWWLRASSRYSEVIEIAEQAIRMNPSKIRIHMGFYNELGRCKTWSGEAEEEIALQAKLNQRNPRNPWQFQRYHRMGWASLLLGRYQDAIAFLQRSLAMNPEVHYLTRDIYRRLAAAYAGSGQMREARHWLTEADRLWPYDTVRSHFPDYSPSSVYAEQIRQFQAALRLAGERDHADEDADFGAMPDNALHSAAVGLTPIEAPGARTIRTMDLSALLEASRPVVVDTMSYCWGVSIPGSVGLKYAGAGGVLTDTAQDRLRIKMHELTTGNFKYPIVAVGWNTERFDGRNLALRLVALGYTNVHWYRGGREAWEVAGLPEADIDVQVW